ncbi:MAG TPA: OsmC family protein [Chthoniobacteraceae bacterium]|nr:OsmC family protein [Chthoniobacteraceae bacterium]
MVKIAIEYQGDLHCSATHGPSAARLETDAPVDNQGKGESFSPTDLVATALGTCMATIMGIYAQRKGLDLRGMKIEVTKEMTKDAPRRIARLPSEIWMPATVAPDPALEHAARTCPVALSLHLDIEKPVVFHWARELHAVT